MVHLVPHSDSWKDYFQNESDSLRNLLQDQLVTTHHIGSTSIPDICAKPQIDIIAVVEHLNESRIKLVENGYVYKGEFNIPFRDFYSKQSGSIKYNIHVLEPWNHEIDALLAFKDYLIQNPDIRNLYEKSKIEAASDPEASTKTNSGLPLYNLKKNAVIKQILRSSGFNKFIVRYPAQTDELDFFRSAKPNCIKEYHESIKLIAYQGTDIVGAAELLQNEIVFIYAITEYYKYKLIYYIKKHWMCKHI